MKTSCLSHGHCQCLLQRLVFSLTITMLLHICLRRVEAEAIFRLIMKHEVTHMCGGAPVRDEHAGKL